MLSLKILTHNETISHCVALNFPSTIKLLFCKCIKVSISLMQSYLAHYTYSNLMYNHAKIYIHTHSLLTNRKKLIYVVC
uniref:Uncharacterized protein n=1 Tax=Octopus bimaculoides TaxID=37653 RepID=A0A0L8GWC0_OCTBM